MRVALPPGDSSQDHTNKRDQPQDNQQNPPDYFSDRSHHLPAPLHELIIMADSLDSSLHLR